MTIAEEMKAKAEAIDAAMDMIRARYGLASHFIGLDSGDVRGAAHCKAALDLLQRVAEASV